MTALTTSDAARIARCSIQAVQAAIRRNKLKATRFGSRTWQIDRADFDAWLSSPRKVGYPKGRPRKDKPE